MYKTALPQNSKIRTWTQSVPSRGSGWVHPQGYGLNKPAVAPTRYREVVLTVSK
jgi:hypothetical protein